jgi:HD-GYP domain-containing protein (c-di-GMP phosphodiesterase class II)
MGLRLGLDRNRLCQLSTAALFHDMGRIHENRGKDGSFTKEDRESMALHPVHGVNLLLGLRSLNEALLKRLIVVFECNIESNGYPRKSWPPGLHLFSRIVAITEAYDAMTTQRSFRSAMTPDEAIREISEHAGSRYDADLVRIFINLMGIYPLGTLVKLDTGEWGLVFHVDPSAPRRPLVKLVQTSDGTRVDQGEIVDLGERDPGGAFRRNIAATGNAAAHGIRSSVLLWEEGK